MVGALLLYMAFLMLVDPLIRKPDAYTEQLHNEEENEVTMALGCQHAGPWAKGSPKVEVPLLPVPVILRSIFLCVTKIQVVALNFPGTWQAQYAVLLGGGEGWGVEGDPPGARCMEVPLIMLPAQVDDKNMRTWRRSFVLLFRASANICLVCLLTSKLGPGGLEAEAGSQKLEGPGGWCPSIAVHKCSIWVS